MAFIDIYNYSSRLCPSSLTVGLRRLIVMAHNSSWTWPLDTWNGTSGQFDAEGLNIVQVIYFSQE